MPTLEDIIQSRLAGEITDAEYKVLLTQYYQSTGFGGRASATAQMVLGLTTSPKTEFVTTFLTDQWDREPTPEEVQQFENEIASGIFPDTWGDFLARVTDYTPTPFPAQSQKITSYTPPTNVYDPFGDEGELPPITVPKLDSFGQPVEDLLPGTELTGGFPGGGGGATWPGPGELPGGIPIAALDEGYLAGAPTFGRATRRLGVPTGPGGGAFGRWIGKRFEPAATAFTAKQFLTGGEPEDASLTGYPFQNFLEANLLGGGVRRQAARTFQGLLDLAQGGGDTALANQFIAPESDWQGQQAAALARSALGNQIGGFALSRFAPRAEDIWRAFTQSGQAANTANILPFSKQFMGIRRVTNPFRAFSPDRPLTVPERTSGRLPIS
jgi:hypothetical protein